MYRVMIINAMRLRRKVGGVASYALGALQLSSALIRSIHEDCMSAAPDLTSPMRKSITRIREHTENLLRLRL